MTEGAGELAEQLRRLRERAALTQEELAARAGLTGKAVGALERGGRGLLGHGAEQDRQLLRDLPDAVLAELVPLGLGDVPGRERQDLPLLVVEVLEQRRPQGRRPPPR